MPPPCNEMRRDRGQDEITERQSPEPAPVVRHLAPNWPMRTMPAPLASKVWTIARLSSACGAIDVILMRLAGISLAEVLWRAWYFGDGGLLHHVGRTPGSNGRDERRHLQSAAARHARVLPSCRLRWLFAAMNSELDFFNRNSMAVAGPHLQCSHARFCFHAYSRNCNCTRSR